jgi:hypothetical protein
MTEKHDYDSTVARIAGNILGGALGRQGMKDQKELEAAVEWTVKIARMLVAEARRTAPKDVPHD